MLEKYHFAAVCDIGLAALRATITSLEQDVTFLGASRTESGELKIDMAKYHATHRCEEHRKHPWRSQDLDQCVPCLRAQLEAHEYRAQQLASWSPVSHACPLCTYTQGKFIAPCAWHREVEAQARVIGRLQKENTVLRNLCKAYRLGDHRLADIALSALEALSTPESKEA
jgi:hypothetical protein